MVMVVAHYYESVEVELAWLERALLMDILNDLCLELPPRGRWANRNHIGQDYLQVAEAIGIEILRRVDVILKLGSIDVVEAKWPRTTDRRTRPRHDVDVKSWYRHCSVVEDCNVVPYAD